MSSSGRDRKQMVARDDAGWGRKQNYSRYRCGGGAGCGVGCRRPVVTEGDDALEGRNVVGGNRINTPVFPCAVISTRHGRNRCEREDS